MKSKIAPCKNCKDRATGDKDCHTNCLKFKKWKETQIKIQKLLKAKRREELFQQDLSFERYMHRSLKRR